jgi:hypothetical protein
MTTKQFITSAIISLLLGYATIAFLKWDIDISSFNMGDRGFMLCIAVSAFAVLSINNKKI